MEDSWLNKNDIELGPCTDKTTSSDLILQVGFMGFIVRDVCRMN